LFKNKVINNISLLVGGTAIAQIITFFGMLYLTKIYAPDSFGLLSLATSLVSLLVPLATLRYDKAIVLAKEGKETNNLLLLCFFISISFFIFLLVIGLAIYLFDLINNNQHYILIILIPLGTLLFGLISVFQTYFEKQSRFRVTSSVAVIDASSKVGIQYFLSSIFPLLGMVLGYISALIINISYYVIKSRKLFSQILISTSKKDLNFVAKKYDKFPKYFTWSNVIDSASQNVCSLVFPFLFSLSILGNFSLAYKIVRLPALLISMATRRAYYPKANELFTNNKSKFITFYKKGSLALFFIAILPVLCFHFFAEDIFNFFFDPNWLPAAKYAKIILWYVFANFCNSLAHENMIIFGLQKRFLFLEIIWFLLSLGLIYIAYLFDEPYFAVVFYAISGIVMEIMVFLMQKRYYNSLGS